jgi:hypothetical protein
MHFFIRMKDPSSYMIECWTSPYFKKEVDRMNALLKQSTKLAKGVSKIVRASGYQEKTSLRSCMVHKEKVFIHSADVREEGRRLEFLYGLLSVK